MKRIYVGNLDASADEEELWKWFEVYGKVDKVDIVKDKHTGQPRGFAFVEMANDSEGEKAIASLNDAIVGGRKLSVNEAHPIVYPPAGGRGRSGGRGRF